MLYSIYTIVSFFIKIIFWEELSWTNYECFLTKIKWRFSIGESVSVLSHFLFEGPPKTVDLRVNPPIFEDVVLAPETGCPMFGLIAEFGPLGLLEPPRYADNGCIKVLTLRADIDPSWFPTVVCRLLLFMLLSALLKFPIASLFLAFSSAVMGLGLLLLDEFRLPFCLIEVPRLFMLSFVMV